MTLSDFLVKFADLYSQPGGRFPSDLALPRRDQNAHSDYSSDPDQDIGSPNVMTESHFGESTRRPKTPQQDPLSRDSYDANPYALRGVATHESSPAQDRERAAQYAPVVSQQQSYQQPYQSTGYEDQRGDVFDSTQNQPSKLVDDPQPSNAVPTQTFVLPLHSEAPSHQIQPSEVSPSALHGQQDVPAAPRQFSAEETPTISGGGYNGLAPPAHSSVQDRPNSSYGEWMAPAAAGAAGAGIGAAATKEYLAPAQEPTSRFSTSTQPSVLTSDTDLTDNSTPPSAGLVTSEAAPRKNPMTRTDTDFSVSALHVPGEFPKSTDKITKA